ncbi:hypothetical protein AYW79_04775 [Ferroacidibacillus organovorans]|uniref:Transcription regulator PadR N-terminal domain-containing protein n=2 Tax=Ferroacidibacillus organovorans TaxID=1765683 RepID=A0A853KBT7_9BACL|nr:hypothetical protein AYJ22_04030 [Ferroacidibacillus organovorans]OAG94555.1 hypothetical protein AYW79_04775 [Ferroacidibacillus organovorans]
MPSLPTLLVLRALESGPMHGYKIARWIEQKSTDTLIMKEGTLYPLLHQLERKGYLKSDWQAVESERKVKVYTLTEKGSGHLENERQEWSLRTEVVQRVLFGKEATSYGVV